MSIAACATPPPFTPAGGLLAEMNLRNLRCSLLTTMLITGTFTVALPSPPAAAEEQSSTILLNPFFDLRTDWNSNVTGPSDSGNIVFRTIAGASLRIDLANGMGILGHYQGQILVTQASNNNTTIHTGTVMFSYRTPITGFIDTVMPYGGTQFQYRQPTGAQAGSPLFASDFFAGLCVQHAPTNESVIYMGAQFDDFVPSNTTQLNYGPNVFVGYRQVLGSTALVGVSDRAQYRMANQYGRMERWRNDMNFEVYYFPWPWLMLNPTAGLQYNSTGDSLTWTTGISVSTNLWFAHSQPAITASLDPARAIEYRDDLRQLLLDTVIIPNTLGLPGEITLP